MYDQFLVVSIFTLQVKKFLCSHHQKGVIVDMQASDDTRKITTFIGGLDLRDGRYDTLDLRLFRDRYTAYQNNYRNATLPVSIYYLYHGDFYYLFNRIGHCQESCKRIVFSLYVKNQ